MANQTWCGNFRLITDNQKIIERLQLFSDMLLKNDNNILSYNLDETIILLDEKDKPIKTNIYTFLFFHDYFNYWKMFSNFNKVSSFLVFSDLFSRDNYLEFDNVPELKDKFFNELLLFFNNNIFKKEYLNDNKFYKNLLTSMAFSETFKYAKNKIIIPAEYEDILIENIFKENIIQYKSQTFKRIFNEISTDKKNEFFNRRNILEYISPFLKLAYSYEYKQGKFIYTNKSQITLVKNDFEDFFMKYNYFFKKLNINEQKLFLNIFTHHNRKKLALEIIENFDLMKEDYLDDEFSLLQNKLSKSPLEININSYFLNKKLTKNLATKNKDKKPKI